MGGRNSIVIGHSEAGLLGHLARLQERVIYTLGQLLLLSRFSGFY